MPHQDQILSKQTQALAQQAPAAMRALDSAELREVVGGPIIDNGGSVLVTPTVVVKG